MGTVSSFLTGSLPELINILTEELFQSIVYITYYTLVSIDF